MNPICIDLSCLFLKHVAIVVLTASDRRTTLRRSSSPTTKRGTPSWGSLLPHHDAVNKVTVIPRGSGAHSNVGVMVGPGGCRCALGLIVAEVAMN